MGEAGAWLQAVSPVLRRTGRGLPTRHLTAHLPSAPHWTEPLRVIYDHQLVLFGAGEHLVELAGRHFACPAATFLVVPPGQWHVTYEVGGGGGHRWWSHFDWVWQGDAGEQAPLMTFHPERPDPQRYRLAPEAVPRGVMHGPAARPERALALMQRLCESQLDDSLHAALTGRAVLLELLVELLDPLPAPEPESFAAARLASDCRRLLDEIAARPEPVPPIQPLLAGLGRSYAHLCRLFRQEYGLPPLRYVHAARMGRAKLLLRETTLGVAQIAHRLGYDDAAWFAQLFRRLTGSTPSAYRRLPEPP